MSPEATERMLKVSVGKNPVSLYNLMEMTFGKRVTRNAIENPDDDPEFWSFFHVVAARVDKEWERRGIDRLLGPYVE